MFRKRQKELGRIAITIYVKPEHRDLVRNVEKALQSGRPVDVEPEQTEVSRRALMQRIQRKLKAKGQLFAPEGSLEEQGRALGALKDWERLVDAVDWG